MRVSGPCIQTFLIIHCCELAAILTDTGNPVRSSEPYIPVVPRRGLPPDLSAELSAWFRQHEGESWFATTWFRAGETAAFAWNDRIMQRRAYAPPQAAPRAALVASRWQVGRPASRSATLWSSRLGGGRVAGVLRGNRPGVCPRCAPAARRVGASGLGAVDRSGVVVALNHLLLHQTAATVIDLRRRQVATAFPTADKCPAQVRKYSWT